jgi:hypothetical protein
MDFASLCLTDFIDWRYIHSRFVFSTQLANCCCSHGQRSYTYVLSPLYLLSDLPPPPPPLPKLNVQEARNQAGIGLSYLPARLCSLATQFQTQFLESIPRPIAGLKFSAQFIQTRQCVAVWRGGELCCRPYSAGFLHSVSDQIQNLQNCFTAPNKMTSKYDI